MKILNWNFFSSSKCSLFWVSCLVFSFKSLFLIFVFSWFWVMFFVQHHCFWFQKTQVEKHIFSKKGGLQHNGFFLWTCVLQNVKSYRFFFGNFLGMFLVVFQKNTIKIGILAHFSKQKITKKWHFWKLLSGPSWKLLSGPSWLRLKKRQLGPDNNFQNFCAQFLFPKKKGWNPYFYSFFGNRCFRKKTNLDQITTSKRAKLGPDNNLTAYIYIYIYFFFFFENTYGAPRPHRAKKKSKNPKIFENSQKQTLFPQK